ncbi:MAG TPA: PDZ domain-containing protein, partial [Vicinamibacteria bacterium]
QVRRDTPGFAAGFNAEDEILAVGGYRVRPDQWDARLESYLPGETVDVLVARRDRLVTLRATFEKEPLVRKLEVRPEATEGQKRRLGAWLGGR